ncbi:nucleotidyltransferase domain-containing protein [Desulfoplanes sp. PS50]|jgi:predicted nucleotidyltransferase
MASTKDKIIRDIRRYIVELNRHGIVVQKTMLFGSWAKGSAREESDVDIALVSSSFSGDRFQDRRKIVPLRRRINNNLEPIPFSPESFAEGGSLVDEISEHGEEIV